MRKKYEGTGGNVSPFVIEEEVTLEGRKILRSTEKAWGVDTGAVELYGPYKGRPVIAWIPKSEVVLETHSKSLTLHDIRMPLWMAKEKFPDEFPSG